MAAPQQGAARPQEVAFTARSSCENNAPNRRSRLPLDTSVAPVNQNGCFEIDRVIKSGCVQKRTQKTKNWKTIYLVLRPNGVSLYKDAKEAKLRHHIYLSELSAVAILKDPKHKRKNLFGLFSASRNFHFAAPTPQDAQEWVDLIRKVARLDEEEDEMYFGSPGSHGMSPTAPALESWGNHIDNALSSSPENLTPFDASAPKFMGSHRRISFTLESSGLSGNEMLSYSDFSDSEVPRSHGVSFENLAVKPIPEATTDTDTRPRQAVLPGQRPETSARSASQISAVTAEQESERVIWQGSLWMQRTKRGVRQWKSMWGVLRARQLVLYKDESEYAARAIVEVADVVNVVEIDPVNKSKTHCLQIITEEKTYRFCAPDEESLVLFLGAFKSLLTKRKTMEARALATVVVNPPSS
ncbi:hypothetical protein TGAM01_v205718 [Trichoderma gamsii]|uniref:PH domain-containing protein n=1 Tax=Trichoderma gamsii TaxID=398673 RepID=A0A2P4ZMC6_9HYPO|nr:hypothetical protein TGAM01_v205718 [Trichoderma gamsii]PON25424.1 hypothetical protein TGAM01_v205718 [Trichoderma gamsii]